MTKPTLGMLGDLLWHRVIVGLTTMPHQTVKALRRRLPRPHGSWSPIAANGIEVINLSRTPAITGHRCRATFPSPLGHHLKTTPRSLPWEVPLVARASLRKSGLT